MLVVNVWEGGSPFEIAFEDKSFGHAAITIPAQGKHGQLYLSWWPGGSLTQPVQGPRSKNVAIASKLTESVSNVEQLARMNTFTEDLWDENAGKFRVRKVGMIDRGIFDRSVKSWEVGQALTDELKRGPDLEFDPKSTYLGQLSEGFHWVLYHEPTDQLYHVYNGSDKERYKVLFNDGHRLLKTSTESDSIGNELRVLHQKRNRLPQKIARLFTETKPQLPVESIYRYLNLGQPTAQSRYQGRGIYLLESDKHTWVLIIRRTPADREGRSQEICRLYHWTREYKAPTNVVIPTVEMDKRGLDSTAIVKWFKAYNAQAEPRWSTMERSCATVALTALRIGGSEKFAGLPLGVLWWTPSEVLKYARDVEKGVKSGRRIDASTTGPNRVTWPERPQLESSDFATRTIVWTKSELGGYARTIFGLMVGPGKELARLLDDYHALPRTDKDDEKALKNRVDHLFKMLDWLAELSHKNPSVARKPPVQEVAERVLLEKTHLGVLLAPEPEEAPVPKEQALARLDPNFWAPNQPEEEEQALYHIEAEKPVANYPAVPLIVRSGYATDEPPTEEVQGYGTLKSSNYGTLKNAPTDGPEIYQYQTRPEQAPEEGSTPVYNAEGREDATGEGEFLLIEDESLQVDLSPEQARQSEVDIQFYLDTSERVNPVTLPWRWLRARPSQAFDRRAQRSRALLGGHRRTEGAPKYGGGKDLLRSERDEDTFDGRSVAPAQLFSQAYRTRYTGVAGVRYLRTESERKPYLVTTLEGAKGAVLRHGGRPLHTRGARFLFCKEGETEPKLTHRYIFVMGLDGTLYSADWVEEYRKGGWGTQSDRLEGFHHSSFLAGAPIAAAGEIQVNQGQLEVISNASGHYWPHPKSLYWALLELKDRGVLLDRVTVEVVGTRFGPATCYLAPEYLAAKGKIEDLTPIPARTPPAPPTRSLSGTSSTRRVGSGLFN